ncbi:TolC family protein [bacterium]|nr:TolC family protein [bacterium]
MSFHNTKITFLLTCLFAFPFSLRAEIITLNSQKVKEIALVQNLNIQQAILDQKKNTFELERAKSIYDTTLQAHYQYYRDNSDRTISVFGTQTRTTDFGADILQQTPWGMGLTASYKNIKESSNSPFVTLNPLYNSTVSATASQSLLKNSFGYQTRKNITAVKKQVESFDLATQAKIDALLFEVLAHYYNLYWAYKNLAYEKEALDLAKSLYKANINKKELGIIENSDLSGFNANANAREAAYLEAKNIYTAALETLRYDLSLSPNDTLKLADEKNIFALPSQNEALTQAMTHRSDYLALKKELEAHKIILSIKRNALWPQLDVNASLALNGVDSSYSNANNKIDNVNEAWGVGTNFKIPLQNRFSRAEASMAKMDKTKKVFEVKNKEQEIYKNVTESLTRYKNRMARLKAAKAATQNYSATFTGEKEKFEQGRSSSDTLIRTQNDLTNYKKQELNAKMDLMLSQTELLFVQGKLTNY